MKFTANNKEYYIKWNYTCSENDRPCKVECIVYGEKNTFENPLHITTTTVPKTMPYDKNFYRKLSLTRTLKQLFPDDYQARKTAWEAYFGEGTRRKGKQLFTIRAINHAYDQGLVVGLREGLSNQTQHATEQI